MYNFVFAVCGGALRCQKRVLDSLHLGLQRLVSSLSWVLATKLGSSERGLSRSLVSMMLVLIKW